MLDGVATSPRESLLMCVRAAPGACCSSILLNIGYLVQLIISRDLSRLIWYSLSMCIRPVSNIADSYHLGRHEPAVS